MPGSPIHDVHVRAGARFTDFGGWNMPVQYDSVLAEHRAVRDAVGVFDVSHLGRFEVRGPGAVDLVRRQLCNDITRVAPGRAQYTMALNESGGVEDDIIVWWLDDQRLWVMPNGTNSDEIVERFRLDAPSGVDVVDVRSDTALLAVQGPSSPTVADAVLGDVPGRFRTARMVTDHGDLLAAGTGYTGERGFEVAVSVGGAAGLWDALVAAGAHPAGLGARDTLRLEMGYPLWGQDLDATTSPLEAGLGWVVAWDHDFVGRSALTEQRGTDLDRGLVGFATDGRAIPRPGHEITTRQGRGVVTSGNFSPTLGHGIGLGYVTPPVEEGERLSVSIRGRDVPATVVDLPFVQR